MKKTTKTRKDFFIAITILLCTISVTDSQPNQQIPYLSEDIGQQIFHENKIYVIYVTNNQQLHQDAFKLFKTYCADYNQSCTILNEQVDKYEAVKAFIGQDDEHYFCILDAQNRKKYILPIIEGLSAKDIAVFQNRFEQGVLEEFQASEEPEAQTYLPCQKIVGKTLEEFIYSETPVKVLFLHTMHPSCEVCKQMLQIYSKLAQNLYDQKVVKFGYYDIFLNDHNLIRQEVLPYFLIYQNGQVEPTGIPGERIQELSEIIVEIVMKDVELPKQSINEEDIDLKGFQDFQQVDYKKEGSINNEGLEMQIIEDL